MGQVYGGATGRMIEQFTYDVTTGGGVSRQFRFFLLPSDAETLIADLRDSVGLKLLDTKSSKSEPIEIHSPVQEYPSYWTGKKTIGVNCYLAAAIDADVKMQYIAKQQHWLVHEERSEVIQFSGNDWDGEILEAGRFYLTTDFLLNDAIWPKREKFLKWADRIFRRAKRTLMYSNGLDAYVGKNAQAWRASTGRFAWMRIPGKEPQWAIEKE